MRLYNSLTRKLEEFIPIKENEVKMYVCGPTVYDYIHIGNARPIVIFDCLRRYFEYLGYNVKYVQNFTDIDDKLIRRAKQENQSVESLAKKYIKEYYIDAEKLNVSAPNFSPKVTENIKAIISMISTLIEKKHAYVKEGNVYFDVSSFKEYGKLSKMHLLELKQSDQVFAGNLKKNEFDFALWKSAKKGEPFWESPWGSGRPGWHIECSAMAKKFLGAKIDIHCGGKDLIFPHHENEIAQSECATGEKFSRFWLHNGHINIDSVKMSKSRGNFLTVREIGKKYGYDVVRYFIISAHYKMPINFTKETLLNASAALKRIYNFKDSLELLLKNSNDCGDDLEVKDRLDIYRKRFFEALNEDFNSSLAVSVLFSLIRYVNGYIMENSSCSKKTFLYIKRLFADFVGILGISKNENSYSIPEDILKIKHNMEKARNEKNYILADNLRKEIEKMGYIVRQTKTESHIFPVNIKNKK